MCRPAWDPSKGVWRKVDVGSDGCVVFVILRDREVVLKGVATEPSEPSGLLTARFFRLIEDLFFLKNVGRELGTL